MSFGLSEKDSYSTLFLKDEVIQGQLLDLTLRISQFHLRSAPPPPPGNCGAFARLVSPGSGAFANVDCPGAGHLPTSGPIPSFWHARGFLSEYNYKEGFTGRKADWLICQGQE